MNANWLWSRMAFRRHHHRDDVRVRLQRRSGGRGLHFLACIFFAWGMGPGVWGDESTTIEVTLRLLTGGQVTGLVADHNAHGLVVVHGQTPYVFGWSEIEAGSAYGARLNLLILARGSFEDLSAEDHFALGGFALARGRNDLAAEAFKQAKRLDPKLEEQVERAFADARRSAPVVGEASALLVPEGAPATDSEKPPMAESGAGSTGGENEVAWAMSAPNEEIYEKSLAAYRTFGEKVREVIGADVVLIETEHFLIWTDWERNQRARLAEWCEAMYAAVGAQLGVAAGQQVFLSKCPVFAWQTRARFQKFARKFDGYEGDSAVGYTRSIEKNGHTHVVLVRNGRMPADYDRFACTLVHEGTHAFLHRLYSPRLIPHWVNEGFADLVAYRVLGERCPQGGNAALIARPFVRYDWPVRDLIAGSGPIAVHQYSLAHSLVRYLESRGRERFARFVRSLKDGLSIAEALAAVYDGMTQASFEQSWREWVRASDEHPAAPGG